MVNIKLIFSLSVSHVLCLSPFDIFFYSFSPLVLSLSLSLSLVQSFIPELCWAVALIEWVEIGVGFDRVSCAAMEIGVGL